MTSPARHPLTRRRLVTGALAMAGASALPRIGTAASKYGIEGRPAPSLHVKHWIDGNGEPMTFDTSGLAGNWQVLKFFQSWCPGCHKHGFPSVKTIADAFSDQPQVKVVAVQTVFEGFFTNTTSKLKEIQNRYDLRVPFGHDEGDPSGDHLPRTMREYRSGGTPWIVIVNPKNQVVFNNFHLDAQRFIDWLKPQLTA